MTLRLTDSEQQALRERAEAEGISMQEAARRAVRDPGLLGSAAARPNSDVFLERNGVEASRLSNEAVYELVMWVAADNPDLGEITTFLGRLLRRL